MTEKTLRPTHTKKNIITLNILFRQNQQLPKNNIMKNIFLSFLVLLLSTPFFAQQTWVVDNAHSTLRFEVGWQDFSVRTGEFKVFDGSIVTESVDDLSNANIKFVVDAASVDVIADRLAMKVKSDAFLNVEERPEEDTRQRLCCNWQIDHL